MEPVVPNLWALSVSEVAAVAQRFCPALCARAHDQDVEILCCDGAFAVVVPLWPWTLSAAAQGRFYFPNEFVAQLRERQRLLHRALMVISRVQTGYLSHQYPVPTRICHRSLARPVGIPVEHLRTLLAGKTIRFEQRTLLCSTLLPPCDDVCFCHPERV